MSRRYLQGQWRVHAIQDYCVTNPEALCSGLTIVIQEDGYAWGDARLILRTKLFVPLATIENPETTQEV